MEYFIYVCLYRLLLAMNFIFKMLQCCLNTVFNVTRGSRAVLVKGVIKNER